MFYIACILYGFTGGLLAAAQIPRRSMRWFAVAFVLVTFALGGLFFYRTYQEFERQHDNIERLDKMANPNWRPV